MAPVVDPVCGLVSDPVAGPVIIVPAHDEAGYIGACLAALLAQRGAGPDLEPITVIVSANACRDATVRIAESHAADFAAKGWRLICLEDPTPGKTAALNRAEALCAPGAARIYLDADVICAPDLLAQILQVLAAPEPLYATGRLQVARARSRITRAYARIWTALPFVTGGAVGAGCFAVNGPGRARWGEFPDIISDDTYVRQSFAPSERIEVAAAYVWPMVEGFSALVKVRRRQDRGVAQLAAMDPARRRREGKARLRAGFLLRLALRRPWAFAVYMAVHLAVRLRRADDGWVRGR